LEVPTLARVPNILRFLWISSTPPGKYRDITWNEAVIASFHTLFQFVIHYSYHLMLTTDC
jgi:hypothetical protein